MLQYMTVFWLTKAMVCRILHKTIITGVIDE